MKGRIRQDDNQTRMHLVAQAGYKTVIGPQPQRPLIPLEEAVGHIDEVVGRFVSRPSGFAARYGGRLVTARRAIDEAVARQDIPSRDRAGGSARRAAIG